MLKLFDYIHFRIYWLSKTRGDNAPETNGTLILSVLQTFAVLNVVVWIKLLHDFQLPNKYAVLPVFAVFTAINWRRYEINFDAKAWEERFSNEDKDKWVTHGWILSICSAVLLLTTPLYGYLHVNLRAI